MILGLAFLNPLLLWALPLAAIPIIIHLLNRRRFQTVKWAAMEYLLRAMKQNRKRMRMEHWLILILRTLAVILLILLACRPQLNSSVLGTQRIHHVVLVDDSASMEQRTGAGNTFTAACNAIQGLAARLLVENEGDLVTVIRSSRSTRPDLAATRVNAGFTGRIRELVTGWSPTDGILNAAALLEEARKQVEANPDADGAEYYFVTDFRRRDWSTEDGKPNAAINTICSKLDPEKEHLTLITVGPKDTENLAITVIRCQDRVCVSGQPLTFSVEVTNRGLAASPAGDIAIELDERSRMTHSVPPLQAGETTSIEITQTFHTAGFHGITAMLSDDRYMPDDRRSLAIEVREFSKILLVDGDPGEDLEESETFFLAAAYGVSPGIDVRIAADHELATMPEDEFADFNLIWLCNVARPDEKSVERLEGFVRSGGGLVITLGNQIDISHYNVVLHKDQKGLLPAMLLEVAGDIDKPLNVHLTAEDHDLFAKYKEFFGPLFARTVLVGRYILMHEDPTSEIKPLLRLEDSEGPAMMVSRPFEQGGTVYAISTSIDALWSNLPTSHTFGMLTGELHRSSARPQDLSAYNFSPLGKFTTMIDLGIYKPDVLVRERGGNQESWTFTTPMNEDQAVKLEVPMAELKGTGLFELILTAHGRSSEVRLLSRNTLLEEGRLERMTQSSFFRTYPPEIQDRVSIIEGTISADTEELAGNGGLWHLLAIGLLAGLLLETLLAWRFGRR